MSDIEIRPYSHLDWEAVSQVCIESGLGGQLSHYFCDGEAFARLWLLPYLKTEPQSCWVAVVNGEVVGYLVGRVHTPIWRLAWAALGPAVSLCLRGARGRYRHHPPSLHFVSYIALRAWREIPRRVKGGAEFHFNVRPYGQEGPRLGPQLMRALFDHALASGVSTLNIQVFLREGLRPHRFYARLGMKLVDLCPCTVFREPALAASYQIAIPRGDLFAARTQVPKLVAISDRPLCPQVIPADETLVSPPIAAWPNTVFLPIKDPDSPYAVAFALREGVRTSNNNSTCLPDAGKDN